MSDIEPIDGDKRSYFESTMEVRWLRIIEAMLGNPGRVTNKWLSEQLQVHVNTISKDRRDPRFRTFAARFLNEFTGELTVHSMALVVKDIMQNRNLKTAMWFLEFMAKYKIENNIPQIPDDSIPGELIPLGESVNGHSEKVLNMITELERWANDP